jgi:hypothetical protein
LLEFFVEHLLSVNPILVLTHLADSCKRSIQALANPTLNP